MMKCFTTALACFVAIQSFAQPIARKTFIITSTANNPVGYTRISAIDVNADKALTDIYEPGKKYAYRTNTYLSYQQKEAGSTEILKSPMGGAVACIAFDAKNNRLYYVPMQLSELRYLDLSQADPSFTAYESQSLNLLHNRDDVANQITRMTIGADGFGYALSNDGEHLVKFSTQNTPAIQDLGVLIDNPKNQVMVRSSCTSWGGDIVGAADGSLYLVTVHNYVFRISLPSKQADYIGQIKNLPAEFTSNGASVDEDGNLLLSCGASIGKKFAPIYKVNWASMEASPAGEHIAGVGNVSDMASSNLLFQNNTRKTNEVNFGNSQVVTEDNLPAISVYPNPISHGRFQLKLANMQEKGEYRMSVIDMTGKAIMETKINVTGKTSSQTVNFPARQAKGVYVLQVSDAFNRNVFSQQLIVE
jgi:hypothetical protein